MTIHWFVPIIDDDRLTNPVSTKEPVGVFGQFVADCFAYMEAKFVAKQPEIGGLRVVSADSGDRIDNLTNDLPKMVGL